MARHQVYIEHDGALFRGFSAGHPTEVWSGTAGAFKPYTFEGDHKPVDWGSVIDETEAQALMGSKAVGS